MARTRRQPSQIIGRLLDVRDRLKSLFRALESETPSDQWERLRQLAAELQALWGEDTDAALIGLHLFLTDEYAVDQPLHVALLADLLAQDLCATGHRREALVIAAITHDIGMYDYRRELDHRSGPLTPELQSQVEQHPLRSVSLLERHGVRDAQVLRAVREHHERMDGSGYPRRLGGQQISPFARMLAIADMYSAMIRPRPYRDAMLSRVGLGTLFRERGRQVDEGLTDRLIRVLGIHPPGTFVRLEDGRIAAVVGRGPDPRSPRLLALMSKRGNLLPNPGPVDDEAIREPVSAFDYRGAWNVLLDELDRGG